MTTSIVILFYLAPRRGYRVGLAGVATLGHIRGRGPPQSGGRDEVGTCSDVARPNLPYSTFCNMKLQVCSAGCNFGSSFCIVLCAVSKEDSTRRIDKETAVVI